MPADTRVHHHPMHHPYPPPGMAPYPSASPHPIQQPHIHSTRIASNGPPPPPAPLPVVGTGGPPPPPPPQMAMPSVSGGPPPETVGPPPPNAVGNGHPHPGPLSAMMSSAARAGKEKQESVLAQLAGANENTWLLIGAVSQQMNDQDRALSAFQNALRHNPNSIVALNAVASIARSRDDFDKAIEYFHRILEIKQDNGEVWGSMGHCLLMKDELPKAYTAYQQALYHLTNPREPKLWYGIGILYDRYGSFEHAEEAFSSVLQMDPNFEKANEIYFRLGIIYKHQRKYNESLKCFRRIINDPPRPLTSWDIWFQLGHVYELDQDYNAARDAYMRVLGHQPDHAKVLQQLGWLYHQPGATFANQDQAVAYLTKSLETDGTDAQSWYLLGRAYMAGQRYNKAYEAYQQAVYRDGRNPTFWCSIGVLYFQINQYRDALDAYSRAIRINPYISEVWYNLGSLYESCNNQITDAIDAYSRAAELDPGNLTIKSRLAMLQTASATNQPLPPAPGPVDVHPSQYAVPPGGGYGNGGSPGASPRPQPAHLGQLGSGADGPVVGRDIPAPHPSNPDMARGGPSGSGTHGSPGPFRGAPPPLTHVDESRGAMSRVPALGPIDPEQRSDAGPNAREYRDGPAAYAGGVGGPSGSGRYDPTSDRHGNSPGSPRRRQGEPQFPPPQGYPGGGPAGGGYPSYPPPPIGNFRERDEWERRDLDRRVGPPSFPGGPVAQHDLRNPSPRLGERGPYPPLDPREYPRSSPGSGQEQYPPPHPYDRPPPGGSGPYPYDRREPARYDERDRDRDVRERDRELHRERERERERDLREREVKPETLSANGGANKARSVSVNRDQAPSSSLGEFRAPSPAASTSSKTSAKRKTDRRDREDGSAPTPTGGSTPSSHKKAREEKSRGPGLGKKSSPTALTSRGGEERLSGGGEGGGRGVSPGPSPVQRTVVPNRAVDEDYDEGAADALMFLSGDRGASAPTSTTPSVSDREAVAASAIVLPRPKPDEPSTSTSIPVAPSTSTNHQAPQPPAVAGIKRADPPSPSSPVSPQNAKKSKPETPTGEGEKKDVELVPNDEEDREAAGEKERKDEVVLSNGNGHGAIEKDFESSKNSESQPPLENSPDSGKAAEITRESENNVVVKEDKVQASTNVEGGEEISANNDGQASSEDTSTVAPTSSEKVNAAEGDKVEPTKAATEVEKMEEAVVEEQSEAGKATRSSVDVDMAEPESTKVSSTDAKEAEKVRRVEKGAGREGNENLKVGDKEKSGTLEA